MLSPTRSLAGISLLILVALPALGQFQFGADWKISGKAFESFQARTYQRHARDYSQMLYYRGRGEQPISPPAARQYVSQIRTNIQASNKALDGVKQAHPDQPHVARAIDQIKQQHGKALAACDDLDAHLAKPDPHAPTVCDHCHDALTHLDAASAHTEKLLKDLDLHELPQPVKSTEAAGNKSPDKASDKSSDKNTDKK